MSALQKPISLLIDPGLENIGIGLAWKSTDGFYIKCNKYFSNMLGLADPSAIVGKKDIDLIWGIHTNKILATDKAALNSQEIVQLEESFIDSTGQPAFYAVTKTRFNDDGSKGVVYTYTNITHLCREIETIKSEKNELEERFNQDLNSMITLSKKITGQDNEVSESIEECALQMLNYLRYIIENTPGNIYWMDKNSVFLGCNKSVATMLGLRSPSEIVGMTHADTARILNWSQGQAESFKHDDEEVIKSGQPKINIEEPPITSADGRILYFLTTRVPIFDPSGQIIGVIGNSIDITDRKLAEIREKQALQEAAKAQALAQTQEEIQKAILTFTGTMSHDLRTPLSTISLVDSLLLKTLPALIQVYSEFKVSHPDLEKGDSKYIDNKYLKLVGDSYKSIAEALKQAESYIDVTLKIIRGAASGSELISKDDLVSCSIEEIIRRVISNYPYKDESDQEKMHSDTMDAFDFMGNSIFMARIIQNLIKNAFEQIHLKGKGEVFIKCEQGEKFNYLYIKDTAGGVPSTVIEHLFDGFNSTKKGGTGIGLSSAKQIMQAFGGDVNCQLVDSDCIEFVLSFPKLNKEEVIAESSTQ